jgi:hypothetical protein
MRENMMIMNFGRMWKEEFVASFILNICCKNNEKHENSQLG